MMLERSVRTLLYFLFFLFLGSCMGFSDFLREETAASEWSSLYMILVFVIAALVLVALVKPMFRKSQEIVASKTGK